MNLNYKPKPLKSLLASSLLISTIIIPFTSVSASEISPSSNWVAATDMDDLYNALKPINTGPTTCSG